MGGMKTKSVHEFLIPSVGLLVILSLWSAAPNALVCAENHTTFTLSDGDSVTCTPIQSQPSLGNGATYNRYPTTTIKPGSNTDNTRGAMRARQTLTDDRPGGCPNDTIPIRAPRAGDVISGGAHIPPRIRGISKDSPRRRLLSSQDTPESDATLPPREYAIASIWDEGNYKGTEVFINVWEPFVESQWEFSEAQLWLASGPTAAPNTIEAGYQVSNGHWGDGLPRLFVYWTADGYNSTGCYNLRCPGFVQVSNQVLLGGSFSNSTISNQKGHQYEIKFLVFKDDGTGDWWLQLNDEYVGYWPKEIFNVTAPFDYAETINWGGEIIDDEGFDGNLHTKTQMGSGEFAIAGYRKAAYLRNLQYVDLSNTLVDARIFLYENEPNCYSVKMGTDYPDWKAFFFYGGKGRSSKCRRDQAYTPSPSSSTPDRYEVPSSGGGGKLSPASPPYWDGVAVPGPTAGG